MSLSGWCSTHGRPQCKWCRSEVCQCEKCGHPWRQNEAANPAQPRALVRASEGDLRDNEDAPARCVNTKRGLTKSSLEGPG